MRISLSRDIQKSVVPGSIVVTDSNNELVYVVPGTESYVLTVHNGVPEWQPAPGGGGDITPPWVNAITEADIARWDSAVNNNIYIGNGVLSSDRTVSGDNNSLSFLDIRDFLLSVNENIHLQTPYSKIHLTDVGILLTTTGSYYSTLSTALLSGDVTHYLPPESGTLALKTDILPETDPTVPVWVKNITEEDINRWNSGVDKYVEFDNPIASQTWFINHEMNKNPSVVVVDSAGTVIYGSIYYVDFNNLTIQFNFLVSGKAYLN